MQDIVESWLKVCEHAMSCNLCRTKKKAECRVNPSLHKPHGLVISEHMRTLHVFAVADKFSKRLSAVNDNKAVCTVPSCLPIIQCMATGTPTIFVRVFNSLFCYANRSKLHGYIWSPSFRQRIFKHRCPRKERSFEQSINTGMF